MGFGFCPNGSLRGNAKVQQFSLEGIRITFRIALNLALTNPSLCKALFLRFFIIFHLLKIRSFHCPLLVSMGIYHYWTYVIFPPPVGEKANGSYGTQEKNVCFGDLKRDLASGFGLHAKKQLEAIIVIIRLCHFESPVSYLSYWPATPACTGFMFVHRPAQRRSEGRGLALLAAPRKEDRGLMGGSCQASNTGVSCLGGSPCGSLAFLAF